MAIVVRSSAGVTPSGAPTVVTLPASSENDVIFLGFATQNGTTLTSIIGNNGNTWVLVQSPASDYRVWSSVQGIAPDTSVTITMTVTPTGQFSATVVRGADTTAPVDVSANLRVATQSPLAPSVTPSAANALILVMCQTGAGRNMYAPEGVTINNVAAGGIQDNLLSFYTYQPTASATGTFACYNLGIFTSGMVTIAVKDDGNGNVKGYHDLTTKAYEFLHLMNADGGGNFSDGTTYDPTQVADENITSMDNGSYTNSSTKVHVTKGNTQDILQKGWDSFGVSSNLFSDTELMLLTGFPITTTPGSQVNHDLSGELLIVNVKGSKPNFLTNTQIGTCFGISDRTNARFWQLGTVDSVPPVSAGLFPSIIDVDDASFVMDEFATPNTTSIGSLVFGSEINTTNAILNLAPISIMRTLNIQGASIASPASFETCFDIANFGLLNTILSQGGLADSQYFIAHNTKCGGTSPVYWDCSNQSAEWPAAFDAPNAKKSFKIGAGRLNHTIGPVTGSTVIYDSCTLNFGNFHRFIWNSDVAVSSQGLVVLSSDVTLTSNNGTAIGGVTFSGCKKLVINEDFSGGNTVSNSFDTEAVTVISEAEFDNLANSTWLNNGTAIQITGNQTHTGAGWDDPNFTMSGNTFDIEYTGATDFSIQSANAINSTSTGAGTLLIVTPILTLNINSDTAATDIRYFEDDSQTVVDSTTGTTLAYNFPDTDVIDIELVKQSYVPVNRQDVTPFDGDFDVFMDFDESYNSGHALTITSQYDFNRLTKVLTINSDQNALNVRSSLADVIRTNSAYFNTPLLMMSIPGLTRVDLTDGMTITSMATWKGAGMEMFDAADSLNPVEKWAAIKSVGDITGATTHFRQTDSGNSTALTLTNDVVDEALQYWADANHDGTPDTDTSDYLLIKAFLGGSKQARVDVLANAGISELASNLFTVPLANADHGYSGSDPGITGDLTLIVGGVEGGKTFAFEIVDGGVNTGADIADQFNFNSASNPNSVIPGGTGLRYFELPDMVIHNATAVETERGFQEGATPTLVGFYASRGGVDHPGFTRFQSNDGTFFTPAVTSNIAVTGMPAIGNEIRLQIYNVTAQTATAWAGTTVYAQAAKVLRSTGLGTEFTAGLYMVATTGGTSAGSEPTWPVTVGGTVADGTVTWTAFAILFTDADPVGAGFADSYTDGEEFIGGDTFRVRFAELDTTTSFKTFETTGIVSSSGFAVVVDAISDGVYTINAIDGSSTAVTDIYTADYANDEIDLDTNLDFTNPKSFAFVSFEQTTSQGMFQIWRIVTAIDAANYRNNVDVLGILFDETAGFVKQEDGDTSRWFRSDGNRPFKDPTTGGNGISMNWKNPVFTISTGSVLTALEKSQLATSASESTAVNVKIGTPIDTDVSTDIENVQTAVDALSAGSGLTAQQTRDAMKLAPTAGAPAAGSVDEHLDDILTDTGTTIPGQITGLNDFDPANDDVANVTLVATTTTNTDMRGTDSANTVVPDNTSIAAILVDTGTTIPAQIAAQNDFDPGNDTVANVTTVATTTTNADMRGTDGANTTAPDNASVAAIKAKTDQLTFTKANELDSNIQSVNNTTVVGDGQTGTEWGS